MLLMCLLLGVSVIPVLIRDVLHSARKIWRNFLSRSQNESLHTETHTHTPFLDLNPLLQAIPRSTPIQFSRAQPPLRFSWPSPQLLPTVPRHIRGAPCCLPPACGAFPGSLNSGPCCHPKVSFLIETCLFSLLFPQPQSANYQDSFTNASRPMLS